MTISGPPWLARFPWFRARLAMEPQLREVADSVIALAEVGRREGERVQLYSQDLPIDRVLWPQRMAVRWFGVWWRFPESPDFLACEIRVNALRVIDQYWEASQTQRG